MKGFGLIGDLQCYLPHQSHLSAGVKFLSMHQIDLSILNGIGVVFTSGDLRSVYGEFLSILNRQKLLIWPSREEGMKKMLYIYTVEY